MHLQPILMCLNSWPTFKSLSSPDNSDLLFFNNFRKIHQNAYGHDTHLLWLGTVFTTIWGIVSLTWFSYSSAATLGNLGKCIMCTCCIHPIKTYQSKLQQNHGITLEHLFCYTSICGIMSFCIVAWYLHGYHYPCCLMAWNQGLITKRFIITRYLYSTIVAHLLLEYFAFL